MFMLKNNVKNAALIKNKSPFYRTLTTLFNFQKTTLLFPSSFIYFLPAAIYLFKALQGALDPAGEWAKSSFFDQFIERFGVIYGILLPLILVRAWEQLDALDRAFDKEADAVKTFYDEVFFLRGQNKDSAKEITKFLHEYASYVTNHYRDETKEQTEKKVKGDRILEKIMGELKSLFRRSGLRTKAEEIIIPKLMDKLNDIIDIRGDRVAIASQRLFESLRIVALIASTIFVTPFYIQSFNSNSSILDNILTISVTLLVVVIYLIIEDFDEPFDGAFRIEDDSWQRILSDMKSDRRRSELDSLDQPARKEPVIWKSRHTDNKKKLVGKIVARKKRPPKKLKL